MILKVNKDICEIKQNEVWNVGDYNVHTVEVELSDEFDGLVNKVRYFIEDNSYDMLITDNVAQVPYEATLTEGTIKIGVYGYDADTNILVQSTSPVNKYITSGTYTGEADNTEPLTPTDKQQMESAIQQNTDDIINLQNNKQDVLISGENIKTINNESILGNGNIEIDVGSIDYNDLTNKPKINNVELSGNKSLHELGIQSEGNYATVNDLDTKQNTLISGTNIKTINNNSILGSGNIDIQGGTSDYTDLINKPSINNVILSENKSLNDLGIQPEGDYALESDIPDVSNFITKTVNDLTYYYKKSETFTKQEVNNLISAITTMDIQVVQTLPVQDISTTTIYLVPKTTAETNDAYDEFIYVSNNWEHIGSTDIDLSGYQTKIDSTHKLPSDLVDDTNQSNLFVTSSEKSTWNNKVDQSELTDYIQKTDYATTSKAGLVRTSNDYAIQVSGTSGLVFSQTKTFSQYNNASNIMFISKGTLANVIDGYGFITNQDVEEYNNLLYKTLDLTNVDKIFTGYIYNGAYSGNQNWRSYEFKAQNIDKIISLSAYTDSSAYKNINFYSKYCSHSSELSNYFISSVPLNEGANKINTYSNIIVPDNCEAIVISHKIQSNMETPIVSLREKKYDKEIEDINSDIKEISNSASNVKAIYKNIWNANDFIFIKDELWLAKPNSTYTGYDQEIRRYKMIDDEWVEQSKLYTDFGHWNTVDYCPENDCLIFGNGANAETTTGNYFTVVKNPLALSGSVLTQDVGIKYNVDIGFKVQAVWGNDNMGEHNIVYLTSNYTRRIVKLLLGKDANGNFDGTFITLSDTTLPTTIGTGGGDFWGDCIYIGDGANYAIWKLSVTDYTVQKIDRTAYLSNGTAISGSTQGIYIDKDYIWVFYNIGTSSNNYLVQYYRGGLTNKSVTTDAHINDLIDAKLGVIENGSY